MAKYKEQALSLNDFVHNNEPTQLCWDYICTLSKVVIAKYFYKYLDYFDKDDLASLATSDAVGFIVKVITINGTGNEIKNIRNVLFTRIRNTLSNFIFRSNRLVSTDDEILDLNVVYFKSFNNTDDIIDFEDLNITSIDSFRTVSLNIWKLFRTNGAKQKYSINDSNDDLSDWELYSEVRNMKKPCDLLNLYNNYTEDQIEELASKLDSLSGQNYFSTLYQLLGDKFLAFLDVFQEDKFAIPSTLFIKHLLTDMSICEDHDNGLSDEELSSKYNRSLSSIKKIIESKEVI